MSCDSHTKFTKLATSPLAIIDGTHLILLPNIELTGDCEDEYSVPAVPLKDVPSLIGRRYISCFNDEETILDECDETEDIIETIQIYASEILDGMITHPINLKRDGSSSSSIWIWPEKGAQHVSVNWSSDSTCLDVHMPVFCESADIDNIGSFEDKNIYGDTCNGLLHDYERTSSKDISDKQSFEIRNAGSCFISDFIGLAGYEQILVLPHLEDNVMSTLQRDQVTYDEEILKRDSKFMMYILERSYLADGYGVLLSERVDLTTKETNSMMIMPPLISLHDALNDEMIEYNAGKSVPEKQQPSFEEYMNIEADNENSQPHEDPPWLQTLQKTIEYRITKSQNKADQIEKSHRMCEDLVARGRNTLHRVVRCGLGSSCTEGVQDPEIVRLRFGMQPRSSMDIRGISVVMDLEIDVYLPEIQPNNHSTNGTAKEQTPSPMHEFYVSCLVSNNLKDSSQASCEQIRTVSSVVPKLHPGECVTLLASAYFTNLDMHLFNEASTMNLSIQGYWMDAVSQAQENSVDAENRQGTILCTLQLSDEALHTSTKARSSFGGRCIHHEVDFVANSSYEEKYTSKAIYEHREPLVLAVDVSSGASTLQNSCIWKDLVSSLNDRIGTNSHIDLCWKHGDTSLKLVIFGSNIDERAGTSFLCQLFYMYLYPTQIHFSYGIIATAKLVLRHLPESAKLIDPSTLSSLL